MHSTISRRQLLAAIGATSILSGAEPRPEPEALYRSAMSDPALRDLGAGEEFCWHARYHMGGFAKAYQAWKDTAWLDQGVRYYEFCLDKMQTGPDGYKGWIGPFIYDKSVWCDVHVGDAILLDGMLEFAEIVRNEPNLQKKYGEAARRYIALARRDLIEKWDARGTWQQDGPFGGYRSWNQYGEPGQLKDWKVRQEIQNSSLSLPFNKQNHMGTVALKLYRLTGDEQYLRKATAIFTFMKSRFQLFDNHYLWNYCEPFGPGDVDLAAHKTRHWIGVHPYRAYQEGEIHQIVEAYHTGVVFDRTDIERIINTNLKVMWNGNREKPEFRNSNATLPGKPGVDPAKQTAGALWTALDEFDPTVRELHEARLARGKGIEAAIQRAYFQNAVKKSPPKLLTKTPFLLHECAEINFAAALPSTVAKGTLLLANAVVPGDVEIALYAGVEKVKTLDARKRSGLIIFPWDGSGMDGRKDCRIRWSFGGGGHREFPVSRSEGGRL